MHDHTTPSLQRAAAARRAGALLAGAALLFASRASADVYGPGWSAVHGDGANTDYAALYGATDLTLAWQRSFGVINLGATFDPAGRVLVTQDGPDCHLYALDPATGATVWCSAAVDRFAVVSGALVDAEGRTFLADGAAMHAFDSGGAVLWEAPIAGVPLSAQFTAGGRLIFITNIGRVYVLRRETGEALLPPLELIPGATWTPADGLLACAQGTADCPSANTPASDPETGRFFFTLWAPGAPQAGVRAMRYSEDPVPTLTALWTNDALPGGSGSSPDLSADRSRIYVNDNLGSVHALDAASGAEIWSFAIGYNSAGSPSLSPDGVIMPAGAGSGRVLALRDTGPAAELVWRRDDLPNRGIPTQAAGGLAYATVDVGSFTNDLVVLDTATGAELDREHIPGTSVFSVGTTVGPDGTVYVPTILGDLYAFRPANPSCPAAPRSGCRRPTRPLRSKLAIRDSANDARDLVRWTLARAEATARADFGDPTVDATFAVCLYDESSAPPRLVYGADVPAGGTCPGGPCWTPTAAGFDFVNENRTPHGVLRLALRAGSNGRARVALAAGAGATFAARTGSPPLPLPLPARLQLLTRNGHCWEAAYTATGVRRNDAEVFRGTGS